MCLPQLHAMPKADRARKKSLIDFGFRLPSVIDHRPINFQELEAVLWWKDFKDVKLDGWGIDEKTKKARMENQLAILQSKHKHKAKTLFASATPANYELQLSEVIAEQIIRPTGLLDPITYVYPKSGDYNMLITSVDTLLKKKPYLDHFFDGYIHKNEDIDDLFGA